MPSAQDVLDAINHVKDNTADISSKMDTANNHLAVIEGKLDAINASVQAVQQLILWGFQQLITLGQYTNQACCITTSRTTR